MPRPVSELLTDRESQLMEVLWTHGPSTAEAVRAALPDDPHDSTVRTLLRVLKDKGHVRIRGRNPAIYEPTVTRGRMQAKATRSLLARLFGGSAEALVLQLVEDEQLSPAQFEQLRKSIASRNRRGGKS